MTLDLTEEETGPLASLLSRTIGDDRYSLSPRIQILKGILAKIRPEPAREPLPPPKVYAPPRAKGRRRARFGSAEISPAYARQVDAGRAAAPHSGATRTRR